MGDRLKIKDYVEGIRSGNRYILAKSISLAESARRADRNLLVRLLNALHNYLPDSSIRIGITGLPGAGKSTFIEAFGQYITSLGKQVAVLTVDPTSPVHGGSILGDKTRMAALSRNPLAFVRPSASGLNMGGLAPHIRESIWLCEAAGFEVILIETVGVGQSEIEVKNAVDFFLLLTLAGAGDDLQGIKRGIMEMADGVVITKADGLNEKPAEKTMALLKQTTRLFQVPESGWQPRVVTCSALENKGIQEIWDMVLQYHTLTMQSGYWQSNRSRQLIRWTHDLINSGIYQILHNSLQIHKIIRKSEKLVSSGELLPQQAARMVLGELKQKLKTR
jgi:LAO/AO transport system kinase